MPQPKCPACPGTTFQNKQIRPLGAEVPLVAITCTKCGAIVGMVDFFNIGGGILTLQKTVDNLQAEVRRLRQEVSYLKQ